MTNWPNVATDTQFPCLTGMPNRSAAADNSRGKLKFAYLWGFSLPTNARSTGRGNTNRRSGCERDVAAVKSHPLSTTNASPIETSGRMPPADPTRTMNGAGPSTAFSASK
ncbi:Uncharacterised protein [uncultured archaeon]|nr:Uncharacterised protein [uncultured archaeon]